VRFEITPHEINKRPENQVTSPGFFKKNQRRVSDKYAFDENGLFSRKIFGRIGACECGQVTGEGYCEICQCRVVDQNNMPDFYIDLGIKVPKLFVDYGKYKNVKELLTYEAFLTDDPLTGKPLIVKEDGSDISEYVDKPIRIGLDAAREIHPDIDEWAKRNMTDTISVPHTIYRPNLRLQDKSISFSPINKQLAEILKNIQNIQEYSSIFENLETTTSLNYYLLSFNNEIYKAYSGAMHEVYKMLTNGKNSFIGSDLKAHRVTGAVKGTVINRHDLPEDIILIGDTFIQTLYPYLYKKYKGDMQQINQHLIEHNEIVLLNRPPTICHLSINALRPRVASCYKLGTRPGVQQEYDAENDTIGIRTLAINPIITDGMGADFDGDCMLVIALYSEAAKKEAETMLPSKNYMNYANGTIRNGIIEDVEYVRNAK
jgi:hypothetical protein